jgi:hypothetical protein
MKLAIPADYEARFPLWVQASRKLRFRDDLWLMVDIQQLGMTERLLLVFESETLEMEQRNPGTGDNSLALTATLAHFRL